MRYYYCMSKFKNTFSDILLEEKKKNKKITTKIVNELEDINININRRTVEKYIKGETVPTYNLAKEILKIFDVTMSEEQLLQVLTNSHLFREIERPEGVYGTIRREKDSYTLRRRISIRSSEFTFLDNTDVPKEDAIDLINERVIKNYGDDKFAFNRYIKDLIDKDMKS